MWSGLWAESQTGEGLLGAAKHMCFPSFSVLSLEHRVGCPLLTWRACQTDIQPLFMPKSIPCHSSELGMILFQVLSTASPVHLPGASLTERVRKHCHSVTPQLVSQ